MATFQSNPRSEGLKFQICEFGASQPVEHKRQYFASSPCAWHAEMSFVDISSADIYRTVKTIKVMCNGNYVVHKRFQDCQSNI